MSERTDLRWYVVNTFSGAEWHAYSRLANMPITVGGEQVRRCAEVWLPFYLTGARRGRWELGRVKPHFPTYLFCGLSQGQHAAGLIVPGVQAIVSCEGRYLVVPPGVVAALKDRCARAGNNPLDRKTQPDERWKAGQSVVIIDGPFREFMGQIASIDKADEIKIWVEAMGRTIAVDVPMTAVRAAEQAVPRRPKVA